MKLHDYILPKNLVEAFNDVNPLEEIKKFLVGFDKASQCDYLPHLKDEELMSFIDIPKEKMLFGEICNLSHGDFDYDVLNPCNDYFCECLFGSRFDLEFISINKCDSKQINIKYQDTNKPIRRLIEKNNITLKTRIIIIYKLGWSAGQSGDPWYFVMNSDDLEILCDELFEQGKYLHADNFSNYLAARIAENYYQLKVVHHNTFDSIDNTKDYINDIIKSRHLGEYHWWESE
jgi:hypothetical protein